MYNKTEILNNIKNKIADIIILDEADSTNNYIKKRINLLNSNSIVIAKKQTSGRGRRGRSFLSPVGGLYLSILSNHNGDLNESSYPTVVAAVAVCRAIEECYNIYCDIKWVNDIYINGKKLCGILCESTSIKDSIIIGIGINISTPPEGFPDEISDIATALSDYANVSDLSKFIAKLYDNIIDLAPTFNIESVIDEYRNRSCVINKNICVYQNDKIIDAKALEITNSASLIVEYPDHSKENLFYGDISIRLDI